MKFEDALILTVTGAVIFGLFSSSSKNINIHRDVKRNISKRVIAYGDDKKFTISITNGLSCRILFSTASNETDLLFEGKFIEALSSELKKSVNESQAILNSLKIAKL